MEDSKFKSKSKGATGMTVPVSLSATALGCSCPAQKILEDNNNTCPICLLRFNAKQRLPRGFNSTHNVICQQCLFKLHPDSRRTSFINRPLLILLGCPMDKIPSIGSGDEDEGEAEISSGSACEYAIAHLTQLASTAITMWQSRAMLKKLSSLFLWLTPTTQYRLIKRSKSLGNRILLELIQNQGHTYRAQQQLWAAIRSKACQFMGPALQDEAIKLILLALEDGSALSKKILIMFVVQRLNPQFPQATKTSIGHVVQLLYRSNCFEFIKQPATGRDVEDHNSSKEVSGTVSSNLMTLRPEFRKYEDIRREHDTQIIKIGLESGLRFTHDQWSQILYGDDTRKIQMQSILDKLAVPQSFKQLIAEYLITIQRLENVDEANLLAEIHPCFEELANIDMNTIETTWENVAYVTGLVSQTFEVLIHQKRAILENRRRSSALRTGLGLGSTKNYDSS